MNLGLYVLINFKHLSQGFSLLGCLVGFLGTFLGFLFGGFLLGCIGFCLGFSSLSFVYSLCTQRCFALFI
jgi:hypothetical protein